MILNRNDLFPIITSRTVYTHICTAHHHPQPLPHAHTHTYMQTRGKISKLESTSPRNSPHTVIITQGRRIWKGFASHHRFGVTEVWVHLPIPVFVQCLLFNNMCQAQELLEWAKDLQFLSRGKQHRSSLQLSQSPCLLQKWIFKAYRDIHGNENSNRRSGSEPHLYRKMERCKPWAHTEDQTL